VHANFQIFDAGSSGAFSPIQFDTSFGCEVSSAGALTQRDPSVKNKSDDEDRQTQEDQLQIGE